MLTTDNIVAALDEQRRTTAAIAERLGVSVAEVGQALQDLACRPLRGMATARGRKLLEIYAAADAAKVTKHHGPTGPTWSRKGKKER
jgi:hypothetical protein